MSSSYHLTVGPFEITVPMDSVSPHIFNWVRQEDPKWRYFNGEIIELDPSVKKLEVVLSWYDEGQSYAELVISNEPFSAE